MLQINWRKNEKGSSAIPVERKMELAKQIREENMGNRLKIRQRERILYGINEPLPLFSRDKKGTYYEEMTTQNPSSEDERTGESTFHIRMVAAILLFVGFLLCDAGGYHIFGYSMNDIHNIIQKDYFQTGEESDDALAGLTELLDFDK